MLVLGCQLRFYCFEYLKTNSFFQFLFESLALVSSCRPELVAAGLLLLLRRVLFFFSF